MTRFLFLLILCKGSIVLSTNAVNLSIYFEVDIQSYIYYIDLLQTNRASLCSALNTRIYIGLAKGAGILDCSSAPGRLILTE